MYMDREFKFINIAKMILSLAIGALCLWVTLPSLKYMLHKDYDVVKGNCVIDITSSGRSADASFEMLDSGEVFSFMEIPELDAYGKTIPYYCEITVTKDHMFEIAYKIYDVKTRKLILDSK